MSEEELTAVRAQVGLPPFHGFLEPEVLAADGEVGEVTVRLPFKPEFQRAPDTPQVHGGVISAFVDLAGHAAVAARVGYTVPTINIRVDYLSAAAGGSDLFACAQVRRAGRTMAVADVDVTDGTGKLVAVGRGTFGTMKR